MKIKYMKITYNDIQLDERDTPKIRGYFANKYNNMSFMHNHSNNKFIYKYPVVQYKVIGKNPIILGLKDEGVRCLKNIFMEDEYININGSIYRNEQREIVCTNKEFGISKELKTYEFTTPWMALNQKNISNYTHADIIQREELLKKILIGNILSMSKSIGYSVESQIRVKINLKEKYVNFKNNKMITFTGYFIVNFLLPEFCGLGKAVSRGFGTIQRR